MISQRFLRSAEAGADGLGVPVEEAPQPVAGAESPGQRPGAKSAAAEDDGLGERHRAARSAGRPQAALRGPALEKSKRRREDVSKKKMSLII